MELQIPGFNQTEWDALPIDKAAFDVKLRQELSLSAAGEKDASAIRIALRSFISDAIGKAPPGKESRLRELLSQDWLDLVIKTNVGLARGFVRHENGMTPGAYAAFPAQRLLRTRQQKRPRDWAARWKDAGDATGWLGALREDFVALKDSPIWSALSAFGLPYPPFDWESGMGVADVSRSESVSMGLTTDDAVRAKMAELRKRSLA